MSPGGWSGGVWSERRRKRRLVRQWQGWEQGLREHETQCHQTCSSGRSCSEEPVCKKILVTARIQRVDRFLLGRKGWNCAPLGNWDGGRFLHMKQTTQSHNSTG